jgi:hypothetical protein
MLKQKKQMEKERDEALQKEAKIRAELEKMQQIAATAIITLVLVGGIAWLLFNLKESRPPPSPPPPSLRTTITAD